MTDRKFLHDLANASMIASGMLNSAIRILEASQADPKALEKLTKAFNALKKIEELVTSEREKKQRTEEPAT